MHVDWLQKRNITQSISYFFLDNRLQFTWTVCQEYYFKECTWTWKQARCPSANEWIGKLWYIYTMEYYSAIKKNSFESVLMRWMKLEPIIQSKVSQKDKDHYSILTHIYGI